MTLLSPGIEVKEIDLSTTIANASTGRAATVGKSQWGPAYQISQIPDETDFVRRFGAPNDYTAATFFSATNFLKYGNDLRFVRIVDRLKAKNSTALFNSLNITITSGGSAYVADESYPVKAGTETITTATITKVDETTGSILALRIPTAGIVDAIAAGKTDVNLTGVTLELEGKTGTGAVATLKLVTDSGVVLVNDTELHSAFTPEFVETLIEAKVPSVIAKYAGEYGDKITVDILNFADFTARTGNLNVFPTGGTRPTRQIAQAFEYGPQTDNQYAIAVSYAGVIVETFVVSTLEGDTDIFGTNIWIDDYFSNGPSQFIAATSDSWPGKAVGDSVSLAFGGGLDNGVGADEYLKGWDLFSDKEIIYVNLLIGGAAADEPLAVASTVSKYIVQDIAAGRADCVAFVDPPRSTVVNLPTETAIDAIVNWRLGVDNAGSPVADNLNVNTSFAVISGNYKFQYDKYSDRNRWVPLSGDIAGLCVYTDQVAQAWYSPAGLNRGQIKGVVKLAIAPKQSQRDRLYEAQINPVISKAGQGFFLYGDKTSTSKPSAFSRINVRRLFNLLERAISEAAQYRLFELNDEFTRNSFRTEINAYLDGIRAQRGVYDFYVECSERNNTPQVIDANEFRAAIMIKPARSINFITLSFVATRTDANFEELLGSF
ncbi:tail sheath protein [Pseudomonas phage Astolliot]|nr:tail sheath protein [Pseudomonas phage Astolliot]